MKQPKKKSSEIISYYVPPPPIKKEVYSLTEICNWYYDIILKQAKKKTSNPQDAEDIAQEVFLWVNVYYKTIDHSRLSSCISIMASRAHVKYCRDMRRNSYDPRLVFSLDDETFSFINPETQEGDPYLVYLRDNYSECVTQLLMEVMPKVDTEVFLDIYGDGKTVQEVADKFLTSQAAIHTRLHRIRERLGVCVSEGVLTKEAFR